MDALDIQNAAMEGMSRYLEWKQQFMAAWKEGMMKGNLRQVWAMMLPQMKEWLKENDPEGYAQVLTMIEPE